MNLKKLIRQFNQQDSLLVISSYPARRGELARDNAVARYTKILLDNFPSTQKIVVISEKRNEKELPYLASKNILVIPAYKSNSILWFFELLKAIRLFDKIKNIHFQFEFSTFGGKKIIPQFIAILSVLKLMRREVSIMLHQVTPNLNALASHLGLKKNSIKIQIFNLLLKHFYLVVGLLCGKLLVHDEFLMEQLEKYVDCDKIRVIPHGTDGFRGIDSITRRSARAKYGFKKNDFVVGVFGYKSSYKGTDWAVNAVSKYAQIDRNIKLMIIGGESPTLKNTSSYKSFINKLKQKIESNSSIIIDTGFLPEKEVNKAFSSLDLVIFPYRSKMSASGAFSVVLSYGIPFMGSTPFKQNFIDNDIALYLKNVGININDISFGLRYSDFFKKLNHFKSLKLISKYEIVGREVCDNRLWNKAAQRYQEFIFDSPSEFEYAINSLPISENQI